MDMHHGIVSTLLTGKALLRMVFISLIVCAFSIGIFQAHYAGFSTDEYAHLGAIESYQHGLGLNPEHPIGQKFIATVWYALRFSSVTPAEVERVDTDQYLRGGLVLEAAGDQSRDMMIWVRLVFVVTNLAVFVWLWLLAEKRWLPPVFTVLLGCVYLFSPSIFGHTALITFDIAGSSSVLMLSITMGLSILYFDRWKDRPDRVVMLVYLLLFWTLNTKFSNVIVGVPFLLWLCYVLYRSICSSGVRASRWWLHGVWIVTMSGLTWLMYAWAFRLADPVVFELPDGQRIDQGMIDAPWWNQTWHVLEPWLRYIDGVVRTANRSGQGQAPFLLGEFRDISLLQFSLIIFWFKENIFFVIATVITAITGLIYLIRQAFRRSVFVSMSLSSGIAICVMALVPVMYAIISANRFLVIGYRHAYPLTVFILALVTWLVWVWYRQAPIIRKYVLSVWVVAMAVSAVFAQADGISALNIFTFHPRLQVTNDSTYNWGQQHRSAFTFISALPPNSQIAQAGFPMAMGPQEQCAMELTVQECQHITITPVDLDQPLQIEQYDYFFLDSHAYQDRYKSDNQNNVTYQKNLNMLQQYPIIFDSRNVVWVYQLDK